MNRQTQGLLLAFLGAVLVRLSVTDAYLRYVTPWMKWPLLVSGLILLGLALGPVLGLGGRPDGDHSDHDGHGGHGDHRVPWVTWLLVLPGLVTFVVSPPELGSYLAERRSGDTVAAPRPASVAALDSSAGPVEVAVNEFVWRAQDGGETLEDQAVRLTGFVSYGDDGAWYVTRLTIGCCAADALAYQVQVDGAERPARDQWVQVDGVYASGTGTDLSTVPVLQAETVTEVEAPRRVYE